MVLMGFNLIKTLTRVESRWPSPPCFSCGNATVSINLHVQGATSLNSFDRFSIENVSNILVKQVEDPRASNVLMAWPSFSKTGPRINQAASTPMALSRAAKCAIISGPMCVAILLTVDDRCWSSVSRHAKTKSPRDLNPYPPSTGLSVSCLIALLRSRMCIFLAASCSAILSFLLVSSILCLCCSFFQLLMALAALRHHLGSKDVVSLHSCCLFGLLSSV